MAKNCSNCGKQLTFRDSFVWENKPICRACLDDIQEGQKAKAESVKQELSDKIPITNPSHIGNVVLYLSLLFGGLLICFIGGLVLAEDEESGAVILSLGLLIVLAAQINFFVLFYQVWRFVINESSRHNLGPSIESPGKAVGYCFIPFYSLYWVFQAFGKFPKDFNAIARKRGSDKMMSEGLGSAIPILVVSSIIPYIGYVTSLIGLCVLYPIFIVQARRLCKEL
jgi:hypothetical protein